MKIPSRLAPVVTCARVASLVTILACPAHSQSTLHSFFGVPDQGFGFSVGGAGDVDGDGFDDVIVGALWDNTTAPEAGRALVFSGVSGSVLHDFYGVAAYDQFGASVSGAGDVNNDGFADLVVGSPTNDNNGLATGLARVFSGRDGSTLYTFEGDAWLDHLGRSVSGAGDVNGDGFDDVIVGAHQPGQSVTDSGYARVFSGQDGSILFQFDGDSVLDHLGRSVSGAGDVNGDGVDDLIVGANGDDDNGTLSGSARVFSGVDGSVLYTFHGDHAYDTFGTSVSGAGDVNGDGFADLIVGAEQEVQPPRTGYARVFSGRDGSVLYTLSGENPFGRFGSSVSDAGDVNGDGHDDLIVAAYIDGNAGQSAGSARVFSGPDGSLLHAIDGDFAGAYFGASVSGAGDVDGDGLADLIVGGSALWNSAPGYARVFSDRLGLAFCSPAVPNGTGLPGVLRAEGSSSVLDNELSLIVAQLPPSHFGYFLTSQTPGFFNPPGSIGFLCLSDNVGRFDQVASIIQGPTGSIQVDLTSIPVNPPTAVQPGETWNFQCWYRDSNPGPTSNFTDAVSVTFN